MSREGPPQRGWATAFSGFTSRGRGVLIPEAFFREVLPFISDPDELRASLLLFWLLGQRRGALPAVRESELLRSAAVLHLMDPTALKRGLVAAIHRGTFLRGRPRGDGPREPFYTLNTPTARQMLDPLPPPGHDREPSDQTAEETPRSNIFGLYEQNIGLLTPLLAEELKEAEAQYPWAWIEDAFREAVRANRRSWRYIARILERWAREGREDGGPERPPKRSGDWPEFIRPRYRGRP
jgi:DNA replication protein